MLVLLPSADAQKKPKAYRLPPVDLKQQVIWGATCDGPDGTGLAFGGEDQKADDGRPHTRIKVNGEWKAIHEELRKKNPLQKYHDKMQGLAPRFRSIVAEARRGYIKDKPLAYAEDKPLSVEAYAKGLKKWVDEWANLLKGALKEPLEPGYERDQVSLAFRSGAGVFIALKEAFPHPVKKGDQPVREAAFDPASFQHLQRAAAATWKSLRKCSTLRRRRVRLAQSPTSQRRNYMSCLAAITSTT